MFVGRYGSCWVLLLPWLRGCYRGLHGVTLVAGCCFGLHGVIVVVGCYRSLHGVTLVEGCYLGVHGVTLAAGCYRGCGVLPWFALELPKLRGLARAPAVLR